MPQPTAKGGCPTVLWSWPLLEEIHGKYIIHLISYAFMWKHASWTASFNLMSGYTCKSLPTVDYSNYSGVFQLTMDKKYSVTLMLIILNVTLLVTQLRQREAQLKRF